MKKRILWLDILRIVCCFCVIMIHVSCEGLLDDPGTSNWNAGNLFDSLARFCIPCLFMISGYLYLDSNRKSISFKKLFCKKYYPILLLMFFGLLHMKYGSAAPPCSLHSLLKSI